MSATATKPKTQKSAGKVRLQPLGDRVVVEREESESKAPRAAFCCPTRPRINQHVAR